MLSVRSDSLMTDSITPKDYARQVYQIIECPTTSNRYPKRSRPELASGILFFCPGFMCALGSMVDLAVGSDVPRRTRGSSCTHQRSAVPSTGCRNGIRSSVRWSGAERDRHRQG